MKKTIYGTTNKGKIEFMEEALKGTDIKLVTLADLNCEDLNSDVVEDGKNPQENALKKAMFFYEHIKEPVLAADSGMYFCDFPLDDPIQPGCHIRRVNGKRMNDLETKEYYKSIAAKHGGKLAFKYCSAVAIVFGPDKYYTLFDDSSSSEHYLYDHDVDIDREGFPLDAISRIHKNSVRTDGYRNFIKECLDKN